MALSHTWAKAGRWRLRYGFYEFLSNCQSTVIADCEGMFLGRYSGAKVLQTSGAARMWAPPDASPAHPSQPLLPILYSVCLMLHPQLSADSWACFTEAQKEALVWSCASSQCLNQNQPLSLINVGKSQAGQETQGRGGSAYLPRLLARF